MASPVGNLVLVANSTGLCGVEFSDACQVDRSTPDTPHLRAAAAQLEEYFAGKRRSFDLALAPHGTPFQMAAWSVLRTIPFGRTMTYGEQAAAMGKPRAVRAVGGANGRNPLAIVVPCHRVIGSGGRLTGYASGIDRKKWLLDHEQN